ncbi:hypothetical protein [Legionella waltersii]|uniref:Transmembrane protein n=1 Tax=Legionella waltersii TaxID=66969 RepID=A0A0W1A594_9GAMM|nr:hypothetical protein [Legionella waltersii]KTD76529.1 transmembrane protein [Legionella waltersii]SNU93954.1 transmembrane protein [Legionella waltersii]
MAQVSDDKPPLKHKELVFILAIAGRIDAQARLLAKELDKDQYVYYTYAVIDSLSSSYTMFKYFFDVFISTNNTDLMHEVLCSPVGMLTVALESLFLVSYSFFAFKYDSEKEDNFKKFIATSWPYFRDVMKGLKNAYKGWRAAVVAYSLISGLDTKYLIVPVGLVLGVLSAANRFWIRGMLEARKQMMISNAALLTEIKKLSSLTHEEHEEYLKRIQYQSLDTRRGALLSAAAGGLIDGLYLYVGVLSLATLAPPTLTIMATICVFYTISTIITRLYEEYDFQLKLLITHSKCKLALTSKELETCYANLLGLKSQEHKSRKDLLEIARLERELKGLMNQFEEQRKILSEQLNRGYYSSFLLGLKNGLYAYGALASLMFFVGSAIALAGIAFPPALLIACVSLGLIIIAGFLAEAIISDHWNSKNPPPQKEEHLYQNILVLKDELEHGLDSTLPSKEEFKKAINDGLDIKPAHQYFYQEWFEVFRSLFSGFGKGQKFVSFAGNSFQEMDDQGHYHDTFIMNCLAVVSGLFFGAVLALRALARGLGRQQLGQVSLVSESESPSPPPPKEQTNKQPTTSPAPKPKPTKSTFSNPHADTLFRVKSAKGPVDKTLPFHRSTSVPALHQGDSSEEEDDIILGLN